MRSHRALPFFGLILLLAGCGTQSIKPSDKHLLDSDAGAAQAKNVPPTVSNDMLPPPRPAPKVEVFSVVVTNVSAQEVLFALARDAKINLDIYPGLQGYVTLNAVNQTLPQILDRISRQINMRYEWNGPNLQVMPDTPFLKQYRIDYVNMERDSQATVSSSSQLGAGAAGGAPGAMGGGAGVAAVNGSRLSITNTSKNHFWETLVKNIADILRETDKEIVVSRRAATEEQAAETAKAGAPGAPAAPASAQQSPTADKVFKDYQTLLAASVIPNPEAGVITVRATGKQHEKIRQFIDQIMVSARRQVMIEATIVEVTLNDNYQQGIDWSKFLAAGVTKGFNIHQTGSAVTGPGSLLVNYSNPTSKFGNISASVSLLETFGRTKTLSSPKISVMNNQTAVLRVVDNVVYFSITVTPGTVNTLTGGMSTPPTYTSTVLSSPVGFTMSLTPQISDSDTVLLNIRPSITRQTGTVNDPNPSLANPCLGIGTCPGVVNAIPVISTREMESMLKIENNQIAILGGLMADSVDKQSKEVPLLGQIPLLGNLFKSRNDTTSKTELVIFLRPVVIRDVGINGDYSEFRNSLPSENFFESSNNPATAPKP